jgi:hypothetical protein
MSLSRTKRISEVSGALLRRGKILFTLQCGEKTRFVHAGSLISDGQSGKPGILLKADFQIDKDDLFKRRLLKSLVVRVSLKTS